jgi:ATP:ADP antiporter, AAA family
MADTRNETPSKNPLRAFFDFSREEIPVVLLMFAFFFLFILVFQMLRPLKKGMFIEAFGADTELYAKLLNMVISIFAVVVYTHLVNHLKRNKLLYVLGGFFAISFAILSFLLGSPQPPGWSIWGFYLWGDLLTTMMVAAFWAYLTDITYPDQAKRLYGAIGTGGVIGGIFGATTAKVLLKPLGTSTILMIAAGLMLLLVVVVFATERLIERSTRFKKVTAPLRAQSSFGAALEGARLTFASKYLFAIMGLMFFYEIGSQVNDYQFSRFTEDLEGLAETQAYVVNASFYANLLAVFVQLFLVSMIMRKLGVLAALIVLPLALIASSTAFFLVPTLTVAMFLFISDNGLNYSIQQTSRESLYVVTSPEEKYKSRAFVNMFIQRLAKGLGIFLLIGLGMLGLKGASTRFLSLITITVMVVLVVLSIYTGRQFAKKEAEQQTQPV